jgi:hypothetical protein
VDYIYSDSIFTLGFFCHSASIYSYFLESIGFVILLPLIRLQGAIISMFIS